MAQTPDGFLWLGTEFGLYRFDGVRAVLWQPPGGEQLPSNYIRNLLVARDGTLWIATLKGLASWKDGKFASYSETFGQILLPLLEDREGTVWFGVDAPGRLCAIQNGKVECYGAGSFGDGVTALNEDSKGNLWVSAQTGVWRWKPGPPERYSLPGGLSSDALIEGDSGALLLATFRGLQRLVGGKFQNYDLPGVNGVLSPNSFLRSSDGSLWIGSHEGLLHLHQSRTDTFGMDDGLSGDLITRFFEDREGNVWVSTTGGLDRFREYAVPRISRSQGLSTSDIYSVQATADGTIWIGTANGLNRWQNGQLTVYGKRSGPGQSGRRNEQELNISRAATEIANSGLSGSPRSLGLDDQGRLWASTSDAIFYLEAGRFIRVPGIPGGSIYGIAADGGGKLWISNGDLGLFYVTPGGSVQQIPWSRFGQRPFGAIALQPDVLQGGVWLGFLEGGIAYFKDGQIRASFTAADGLGGGRVNTMRFGSTGTLWAATEGGLSQIRDGRVLTLTSKNGLPCDEVHWSIEDDNHFVWLYMPCGLVRITRSELDAWVNDPKRTLQTTTFDASDGVMSVGFAGGFGPHVTKSSDGKLWFATPDGVSVIDPLHLPFNKLPPPVHIEQVTADRKNYGASSDATGRVQLPPLVRDLEIDYTALSLVAPEKMQFRYKLEGFDTDWQDAGDRRSAFYTNLPPRNYRFRVMASNNSGVWNETGTFLDFTIAPAYYQTNWFRLALLLGFGMLLVAIYQLRLRQVAATVRGRMEERLAERERIARDLHDTLLQSVQGLILKFDAATKQIPRDEPARQTLEKTLDHADEVLAEGRDRLRNLRGSSIPMGGLPAAFERVAEETAQNGNITFKTVVEGHILELHPMVREEAYCIGREAIANAITHSAGRNVEVEITYDPHQFRLRVRDDGTGIDQKVVKDGRPDHFGLQGMRERAQRIGAQLELWSRQDTGTEIQLTVPGASAYRKGEAKSWSNWLRDLRSQNRER